MSQKVSVEGHHPAVQVGHVEVDPEPGMAAAERTNRSTGSGSSDTHRADGCLTTCPFSVWGQRSIPPRVWGW